MPNGNGQDSGTDCPLHPGPKNALIRSFEATFQLRFPFLRLAILAFAAVLFFALHLRGTPRPVVDSLDPARSRSVKKGGPGGCHTLVPSERISHAAIQCAR